MVGLHRFSPGRAYIVGEMRGARWDRFVVALVLLAEVFGLTLYVAATVGPFAALLGVAAFGAAYMMIRIRRARAGRTPSVL